MSIELDVFFIYRFATTTCSERYVLFAATRPEYHKWSLIDAEMAQSILEANRDAQLEEVRQLLASQQCGEITAEKLIGFSDDIPVGEDLFDEMQTETDIFIAATADGYPSVIFGTASSEDVFWEEVEEDYYRAEYGPFEKPARKLRVLVYLPDQPK